MKTKYLIRTLYIILIVFLSSCGDKSISPNTKKYKYGENLGKITFWTTWNLVNTSNIKIEMYDSKDNKVFEGFLSQYYNYGAEPDCDDNIYGATSSKILPAGFYTLKASANTSSGNYTWGPRTIEIEEDVCLTFLLR